MSANPRTILLLLAITLVALAGCADDSGGESWRFDEPPPESTVNQSLCTEMPGTELERPQVTKLDQQRWRIRYPAFSDGCGVYQMDGVLDFAQSASVRAHSETSVCNRCNEPQQINFLSDYLTWMAEPPENRLSVPSAPRVTVAPGLFHQGGPVLRLGTTRDAGDSCPGVSYTRAEQNMYPSYSDIWRVELEPGAVSERRETRGDLEPFRESSIDADSPTDGFRIYWPRMYHPDVSITGMEAASNIEFCEKLVYHGDTIFDRPYDAPYRLEAKYVKQASPGVELPVELARALRESTGDSSR